jgi:hypothetical protein
MQHKPYFVSTNEAQTLIPIPLVPAHVSPAPAGVQGLYAVARSEDDCFTLWLNEEELNPYKLPRYSGSSQTVKQVLLTPGAVAVDLTIVGAILAIYYGEGLAHSQYH